MTVTHILAEFNGTNAFTIKLQERSGVTIVDSYSLGDIDSTLTGVLMKAWKDSGLFSASSLLMKISSTEFNA